MSAKFDSTEFHVRQKIQNIYNYIRWILIYRKCSIASKKFSVHGNLYSYFIHYYNQTWANERAIEIPIVWELIKKYNDKNILEIGNVFSHYFSVCYDIVDKYEMFASTKIIQKDIVDYETNKKYDLIVSISTIEHIGWDELHREPEKIFRVFKKIFNILDEKGKAIFTIPVGYNPYLDKAIYNGRIKFPVTYCLKRINKQNEWKEVSLTSVLECNYGKPFPNANGIIIGFINKDNDLTVK